MVLETERVSLAIFFQANPTLFFCSDKTFTFRFRCFIEDLLLVKEGERLQNYHSSRIHNHSLSLLGNTKGLIEILIVIIEGMWMEFTIELLTFYTEITHVAAFTLLTAQLLILNTTLFFSWPISWQYSSFRYRDRWIDL